LIPLEREAKTMLRQRLSTYRSLLREKLEAAFNEDLPPHEIAATFGFGVFVASLPNFGLALVLFVAGALLLVAEALAPGAHFFVVGVALLTAGMVGLVLPAGSVLAPLILAVVVPGVTALTPWGYRTLDIYGGEGAARPSDSSSLRGSFGYVTERVTRHEGEVKLDDGGFNPYYRARSEDGDIEEGEEVMVVDPGGGNVVTVTPVTSTDDIERELAKERDGEAPTGGETDEDVETTTADAGDESAMEESEGDDSA
jgi:membrane protein implicated in regulation of membrane protease activity